MRFSEMNLNEKLMEAISYMGFENATPIQEKVIPEVLQGNDILACAQTGTGKTAAFVLPVLQFLATHPSDDTAVLILVPTRELAIQIDQQIQGLSYFLGVESLAIYGGGDGSEWGNQKKSLTQGANIVVATPGKLISHLNMGYVKFDKVAFFILDEADRMLDMNFYEDIKKVNKYLPQKKQTLMFSATMAPKIKDLAKQLLHHHKEVVMELSKPAEGVKQTSYLVFEEQKVALLNDIIKAKPEYESILIFSSTKLKIKEIITGLRNFGISSKSISSDLTQDVREEILLKFRAKQLKIIVATDVLSRGIDIKDINLVVNYDVPNEAEDYVHRVGRTARANTKGEAITFVNPRDMPRMHDIETLIGKEVERLSLPDFLGKAPEWNLKPIKKKGTFKPRKKVVKK